VDFLKLVFAMLLGALPNALLLAACVAAFRGWGVLLFWVVGLLGAPFTHMWIQALRGWLGLRDVTR
jgi:hypothetical protein